MYMAPVQAALLNCFAGLAAGHWHSRRESHNLYLLCAGIFDHCGRLRSPVGSHPTAPRGLAFKSPSDTIQVVGTAAAQPCEGEVLTPPACRAIFP